MELGVSLNKLILYNNSAKYMGLAGKIILFILIPALIVAALSYIVFTITLFQSTQLHFRSLNKAMHIVRMVEEAPDKFDSPAIQAKLLGITNIHTITVTGNGHKIVLPQTGSKLQIDEVLNFSTANWGAHMLSALNTMLFKPTGAIDQRTRRRERIITTGADSDNPTFRLQHISWTGEQ